ncbi:serine hydrolase domain-containing protein [Streptomyces formicae]|uniref:serine hydrolase domain-containing protein n=1 Tax=Streptomyces formicae TaxID=1616117 RepID=UPI002D76F81A|nr:serine hydrolase domain-containing protein [Streptomyces formicae]
MRHEPAFPAGTGWAYSNTNYVLAGMIIEKVTGRTWEQQVHDRVLRPLGLRDTDTPGIRPFLPRPHAADHQQFTPAGPMVDTTIPYRPFDSGADGSMTGTARDLNRFFAALASGKAPATASASSSPPCPAAAATSGTAAAASATSSGRRPPRTVGAPSPSRRTAAPRTRRPRPGRRRRCATSSTTPCAAAIDIARARAPGAPVTGAPACRDGRNRNSGPGQGP